MDIQEREAFENALQKRHKNILRWVMWVESIQKYVMSPKTVRHDDVYAEKAYRKIQDFLYAWQAAKAVPEGFVLIDNSELESLKSDNEHFTKSCIDWTERAYKQRAKVELIKNEVERFKQSGTHLDLSRFLDNLIEFSTFKNNEEFEGFVLVPKADLESWHLWDGDSDNMYRDHYSESICDDVELGAVFEIDAKMAFKVDPIYVVPIYSDSDDFEYEEFESEELAKKAAAENKAMIEAQEPTND